MVYELRFYKDQKEYRRLLFTVSPFAVVESQLEGDALPALKAALLRDEVPKGFKSWSLNPKLSDADAYAVRLMWFEEIL